MAQDVCCACHVCGINFVVLGVGYVLAVLVVLFVG